MRRREFLAAMLGAVATPAFGAGISWIDVHMHLVGGPQRQFGEAVDRAIQQMDATGVSKAVAFPPPMPQANFDYSNYLPELGRYPGRFGFLGGGGLLNAVLQQTPPDAVTPEIRQTFVDTANKIVDVGAAGFGEIALLHLSLTRTHPFEETQPEHPLMFALVEVAAQRGVVIDLHMDTVAGASEPVPALQSPQNPPTVKGNIPGLERLLARDRKAKIVWAHGGSDITGNMSPILIRRMMDTHSNLYMSLRPVPPMAGVGGPFGLKFQNRLLTEGGLDPGWSALLAKYADRFVMGGDTFFIPSSLPGENAAATFNRGNEARLNAASMLLAKLPADVGRKVATENAKRLYKI